MAREKQFILSSKYTYGPLQSRRYGNSLGVNVLPIDKKVCSFNCPYCQCGWTYKKDLANIKFPNCVEIIKETEEKLKIEKGIDVITFAGNGEPTMHPAFAEIVKEIIALRDRYCKTAKTVVLTDGAHLREPGIKEALEMIDFPMIKLDAGTESMFKLINIPMSNITLRQIVDDAKTLSKRMIQAMFVQGRLDNTTEAEISAWLKLLGEIVPSEVHIYSIDRYPADTRLKNVPTQTLREIVQRVKNLGFSAEVY